MHVDNSHTFNTKQVLAHLTMLIEVAHNSGMIYRAHCLEDLWDNLYACTKHHPEVSMGLIRRIEDSTPTLSNAFDVDVLLEPLV